MAAPRYALSAGLYVRCLAVLHAWVLGQLWLCGEGTALIGPQGLVPAGNTLDRMSRTMGPGTSLAARVRTLPTLLWFLFDASRDGGGISDAAIDGLCLAGTVAALLAAWGSVGGRRLGRAWLLVAMACLVSVINVGPPSMFAFKWDFLLVEASLLALFLPPLMPASSGSLACTGPPRAGPLLATRWLCFRFMFAMGVEKLPWVNDCPQWWDLTYTRRFMESEQPKPTALAWLLFQLPMSVHHAAGLVTCVAELPLPVLGLVGGEHVASAAALGMIFFQLAIHLAGNFATFNLVSSVLCIPLISDQILLGRWRCGCFTRGKAAADLVAAGGAAPEGGKVEQQQREQPRHCRRSIATLLWRTGDLVLLVHGVLGLAFLCRIFEPSGLAYLGNSRWMEAATAQAVLDLDLDLDLASSQHSPGAPDDHAEAATAAPALRLARAVAARLAPPVSRGGPTVLPHAVTAAMHGLDAWRVSNQYGGIFHDTFRHDGHRVLIFQASADGEHWGDFELPYTARAGPAGLRRMPAFFAPRFPRLDHAVFYEANHIPFYAINPALPVFHRGHHWLLPFVRALLRGIEEDRGDDEEGGGKQQSNPSLLDRLGVRKTKRLQMLLDSRSSSSGGGGGGGSGSTRYVRVLRATLRFTTTTSRNHQAHEWWRLTRVEQHLLPVRRCTTTTSTRSSSTASAAASPSSSCVLGNCAAFASYVTRQGLSPLPLDGYSRSPPGTAGNGAHSLLDSPFAGTPEDLEPICGLTSRTPLVGDFRPETLEDILGRAPSLGGEWRHLVPRAYFLALRRLMRAGRRGGAMAAVSPGGSAPGDMTTLVSYLDRCELGMRQAFLKHDWDGSSGEKGGGGESTGSTRSRSSGRSSCSDRAAKGVLEDGTRETCAKTDAGAKEKEDRVGHHGDGLLSQAELRFAFRRDWGRRTAAAGSGSANVPSVLEANEFARQLLYHADRPPYDELLSFPELMSCEACAAFACEGGEGAGR